MSTREARQRIGDGQSEQLLWLGLYDNLTNLPNRYLFLDRLHHIKRQAAREKYEFAVLMINLRDFRRLNAEAGHQAGDLVLVTLADRLRDLARDSDTIARFGGDVYTVILRNIKSIADAESIAGKYSRVLHQPIASGAEPLQIKASIGISCYPQHSEDINELLHQAEKAMLDAAGSDAPFSVYSELFEDAVAVNLYNYNIDELFRDEDIRFRYQPICTLTDRRIVSVEALCRWNHPVMGEIYPEKLIIDAMNSPSIKSFVSNSLRHILNQNRAWQAQGITLPVHFNLSAYMLNDPYTTELIVDLLNESQVAPELLVIELTETEFYSMNSLTIRVIQELADRKIRIALDDFGVGFSSMSHLLEFPIDLIKIDRVFVEGVHRNHKARVITEALIDMSHQLGASVVAEGVDNDEAVRLLQELGCDYIQSHAFYQPLSVEEIEERLNPAGRT